MLFAANLGQGVLTSHINSPRPMHYIHGEHFSGVFQHLPVVSFSSSSFSMIEVFCFVRAYACGFTRVRVRTVIKEDACAIRTKIVRQTMISGSKFGLIMNYTILSVALDTAFSCYKLVAMYSVLRY